MNKRLELLVAIATALLIVLLSAGSAAAATATDLRIRATAGSHRVGRIALYTVTVTNRGPGATDAPIHVRNRLPAGLSLSGAVSADWSCSASGSDIDCVFSASLPPGRSTSIRLYLGVCTDAFPRVSNTFIVEYDGEINPANNSVTRTKVVRTGTCTAPPPTVTARPGPRGTATIGPTATATPAAPPAVADLQLNKTAAGAFTVGALAAYNLSVVNAGPNATNNTVTVTDSLPVGLTYVSSSGSGWSCSASAQTVTCTTSAAIASGGSSSFSLTVAVGDAAYPTVTNSAAVSYAGDPDSSDNSAQKPTTVRR